MYRGREGHWGGHTHFLEKQHFCNSFYHLTSDMVHMYDLKSCQSFDLEIPKKVKSKQGELYIFFFKEWSPNIHSIVVRFFPPRNYVMAESWGAYMTDRSEV